MILDDFRMSQDFQQVKCQELFSGVNTQEPILPLNKNKGA